MEKGTTALLGTNQPIVAAQNTPCSKQAILFVLEDGALQAHTVMEQAVWGGVLAVLTDINDRTNLQLKGTLRKSEIPIRASR